MPASSAYLVESIPLGMDELRQTDGIAYTEVELKRQVDRAQEQIDLAAMYWHLLPDPTDIEEEGFSEERLAALGADHGRLLIEALADAAGRGVSIRILQGPGFKEGPHESNRLAQSYPEAVHVRQLHMEEWFGGGVMHQKLWVFDRQHVYIGSANMDWRALTQVKELGVIIEHNPDIATDAGKQFEFLWQLSDMDPATARVFDPVVRRVRTVPSWSTLIPASSRLTPPLTHPHLQGRYNISRPLDAVLNGESGDVFITGSPREFCAAGRTTDLDGILDTIHTAEEHICISVMNFAPHGLQYDEYDEESGKWLYQGEVASPLWWPVLVDALLQAVVSRRVHVRLLASQWWYTSPTMVSYLRALQATADACGADPGIRCGKLEIKRFFMPGWDNVSGPERAYPGHSRVNHAKYIVTERRLNIGTSNLSWSYFANSVGTSFNSSHQFLVRKLQEVFDRDWGSAYAVGLE